METHQDFTAEEKHLSTVVSNRLASKVRQHEANHQFAPRRYRDKRLLWELLPLASINVRTVS